jgi:hypothetical protein
MNNSEKYDINILIDKNLPEENSAGNIESDMMRK